MSKPAQRQALTGALSAFAALGLAACHPVAADAPPQSPPPPADAPPPPNFSKPINAVGTEPFWAMEIRADRLKLSGPDRQDVKAINPGPKIDGDGAVWAAAAADGAALKVTLSAEPCSDGMSDLAYPFTARVETAGEVLNGCAAPLDAWPRKASR